VSLVALLLTLALAIPAADAARKKRRKRRRPRPPGNALVLGSSSMNGAFGSEIVLGLKRLGYKVHKRGQSSTGLARPDYFDWLAEIKKLPIDRKTAGAVIYLGTNDAQAIHLRPAERKRLKIKGRWLRWKDRRWVRVYAKRVSAFARALCKLGVHRVAIISPVNVVKQALRKRLRQVRTGLARGARPVRCARAFSGRGDLRRILRETRRRQAAKRAKARKRRTKRSKRRKPPPKYLRQPDGTHLTRHGARTAWKRVERSVHRWFKRGPVPKRVRKQRHKKSVKRRHKKSVKRRHKKSVKRRHKKTVKRARKKTKKRPRRPAKKASRRR